MSLKIEPLIQEKLNMTLHCVNVDMEKLNKRLGQEDFDGVFVEFEINRVEPSTFQKKGSDYLQVSFLIRGKLEGKDGIVETSSLQCSNFIDGWVLTKSGSLYKLIIKN